MITEAQLEELKLLNPAAYRSLLRGAMGGEDIEMTEEEGLKELMDHYFLYTILPGVASRGSVIEFECPEQSIPLFKWTGKNEHGDIVTGEDIENGFGWEESEEE